MPMNRARPVIYGAFFAMSAAVLAPGQVQGEERWASADGAARAKLPDPARSETIVAGELVCAEQRWSLLLALADGVAGTDGARAAEIAIGENRFDLDAERTGSSIAVAVTSEVLPPLRAGIRMDVLVTGGESDYSARFSLVGSRRAIDEAAPRCSRRDMSAYRAIMPGELNPETVLARELLDAEIEAFRTATKSEPAIAAALHNAGAGKRLLFATICGSSWYYGNSGCNMTVHAQEGEDSWRRVYETEGVAMHIDPNAQTEGWPNLVTLSFDGDEIVWHWEDGEYLPPFIAELHGG